MLTEEKPTEDAAKAVDEAAKAAEDAAKAADEAAKVKQTPEEIEAKRKGGFQRKIDKLTGRITAAEERAAAAELALARLQAGEKSSAKVVDEAKRPEPADFEKHADYVEALSRWSVQDESKKLDAKRATAEAASKKEALQKSWNDKVAAARLVHADFDEVLDTDLPLTKAMNEALFDSEHGALIAYHLAQNPELANRVAEMSPMATYREIGKLELIVAPKNKPGDKKVAPLKPLGSTTSGSAVKDPENMNYREFKDWRAKSRS